MFSFQATFQTLGAAFIGVNDSTNPLLTTDASSFNVTLIDTWTGGDHTTDWTDGRNWSLGYAWQLHVDGKDIQGGHFRFTKPSSLQHLVDYTDTNPANPDTIYNLYVGLFSVLVYL